MRDGLNWLVAPLGGLLILAIAIGTWVTLSLVVTIADAVGEVPFAIVAGLALSRHHRSSEARGERVQRLPSARTR